MVFISPIRVLSRFMNFLFIFRFGVWFLVFSGLLFPLQSIGWWMAAGVGVIFEFIVKQKSLFLKKLFFLTAGLGVVLAWLQQDQSWWRIAFAFSFSALLALEDLFFSPQALDRFSLAFRSAGQQMILFAVLGLLFFTAYYLGTQFGVVSVFLWLAVAVGVFILTRLFFWAESISVGSLPVWILSILAAEVMLILYFLPLNPWFLTLISSTVFVFIFRQLKAYYAAVWNRAEFLQELSVVIGLLLVIFVFSGLRF